MILYIYIYRHTHVHIHRQTNTNTHICWWLQPSTATHTPRSFVRWTWIFIYVCMYIYVNVYMLVATAFKRHSQLLKLREVNMNIHICMYVYICECIYAGGYSIQTPLTALEASWGLEIRQETMSCSDCTEEICLYIYICMYIYMIVLRNLLMRRRREGIYIYIYVYGYIYVYINT